VLAGNLPGPVRQRLHWDISVRCVISLRWLNGRVR
jgi:hypothetical protein